ncbi:hypothetical protein OPQ81_008920 [Rhizoctonia solani]|nr:hypothetical protein OPQ81_008920 [Rhizoctonia solani]
MATGIVNPLLTTEPFEEASEGPRSPVSEKDMKLYYEEQERNDKQRRLSKNWRRSFKRSNSKNNASTESKATSEPDSEAYGTGQEDTVDDHLPTDCAPPTPGPGITYRKALAGRPSESSVPSMTSSHSSRRRIHVDQQQDIPWHMRRYEIYQPPSFVARAPPRYYNFHLLSASGKERVQREISQYYAQGRLPSLVSSGSVFSGVGSGTAGGSVRSSLSVRRPSMLASAHFGSAGAVGLETITASPASTAAPLNSPSLDPMNALNAGPAANHRLSTWLKRPPRKSTHIHATHTRGRNRSHGWNRPLWRSMAPFQSIRRWRNGCWSKNERFEYARCWISPHPFHGRTFQYTEPPLPDPPGSPDLLSGTRPKRKLSKRRSTSASRGGALSSLFTRKTSVDEDHPEGARTGGLRGRSRPPLSPSSQSLAQTQGIVFPTEGGGGEEEEKNASDGNSANGVAHGATRDVEIIELPSAKPQSPQSPQPRPPPQRPLSQRPPSFQHHRPPSSQHHSDPPLSAPPVSQAPAPPSVTTNKRRERKISAASINSFLSRITSRDKDKDKDRDPPRSESVQDHRKVPPHKLLNHVGKDPKSGNMFTRFARKLSLIRRRSVDVIGNPEYNSSRPSFTVERRPPTAQGAPMLQRRATLDLAPSRSTTYRETPRAPEPLVSPPPPPPVPPASAFPPEAAAPNDLFAPLDPQLRSSRLINTQLSPPPRIPDLLQGDRNSWAASLHRKVSTKSPDPPALMLLSTDELVPPPPIGGKHPDSPHSIPKWGITTEKTGGPLLLENGSPTDESPISVSKGVLTVVNPDVGESEVESVGGRELVVSGKEVAIYGKGRVSEVPVDGLKVLRAQLEAAAAAASSPEDRRNRELPPDPGASTKPLVIRKDVSRSRSSSLSLSGRESPFKRGESPLKRGGRDSPVKRRESPVKRGKRDSSPIKPIRRSEPLKDHSAVNGADVLKSHGFRPVGASGMGSRAIGSTTSVDAIQGDDDAEFGAKPRLQEDLTGRQRMVRSRASTDSIGKMHVITPKTSLQKIRVRVVSNPPPVEIAKESSPVKEDPPAPAPVPERTKSSKAHPRSGYTGADSRHSIYGTATSESSDIPTSPAGPRKRISTVSPDAPPRHPGHSHSKSLDTSSKMIDVSTPYMTPTADHAPFHPFSEKPIEYQNMPPISVMRFETTSPPPAPFYKQDAGPSKMVFPDSKGAWIDSPVMSPPKAPFMNDEFSVSKEKLAAQGEFKKHHKRESTAESERRRAKEEAKEERARQRAEWERTERERLERLEKERQERERSRQERAERLERERLERERREQERLERERLEQERREQERREQERREQERREQERREQERREQERLERERLERQERERAERERMRAAQRQKEEQERMERIARELDLERVEKERQERERQEFERERIERERRLEWERMERERLMEEELRRREPPALLPTNSGRRNRHDVDGEREVIITSPKEPRKSKRRNPNDSRSTSPTSTVPPPPPKENQPLKVRQRSQTDAYAPPITSALSPPIQQSIEVIAGVPVLPEGIHVEVAQPFQPRPTSVNTIEAPSLKAREAWERDRLDKGQSVLVPGVQRPVIPDIGSPRPTLDPRQRQASNKGRSQTPLVSHSEPVVPPLSEYGPSQSSYSIPTFPPSRSHNPLPKPPTIDGPYPLHRPGAAYANPNRQRPGQGRPSGSRNPLPEPPRVSSYPLHHNVSPPRGLPPGAVR